MTMFYDALETRSREAREAALMAALPQQILHAQQASPAFAGILADVDAAGVTSRAALARLPVTRKSELLALQQQHRAPGGSGNVPGTRPAPGLEPGFFSLFDGQTLDGWEGDRTIWTVEDGAITGRTTAENDDR